MEISFGYGSGYDGDTYSICDGYIWEKGRRYIRYLTKEEVDVIYPGIDNNVCDSCVSKMMDRGHLRHIGSYDYDYDSVRCNKCDLCDFVNDRSTSCSLPFLPDLVTGDRSDYYNQKEKTCLHENCVSVAVKEVIGKPTTFVHYGYQPEEYNPETLYWRYGRSSHRLLSDNMDVCRRCVERLIQEDALVSQSYIEENFGLRNINSDVQESIANMYESWLSDAESNEDKAEYVNLISTHREDVMLLKKRNILLSVIRGDISDHTGRLQLSLL
jgi:hypothetical protein